MAPTIKELGIDRMSIEDRFALAQQFWDSISADLEREPLTPTQRVELERRVALADANPGGGIPWEVIRAEARARWRR
jgi:putative addiction module component (TIGR02574 family)